MVSDCHPKLSMNYRRIADELQVFLPRFISRLPGSDIGKNAAPLDRGRSTG
jgi:hypothetical protein